ncbi:MAG: S41 family peptidase [Acidobacteriota bacterium]
MSASTRGLLIALLPLALGAEAPQGYYRFPAINQNTIIFTAEGDLWKAGIEGGVARRLTSHLGEESRAAISPDGAMVAFSASYEGPTEAYVMPADGGLPKRLTYSGGAAVAGWTPDGKVLCSTRQFSTLPDNQLVKIDPRSGRYEIIPLSQADQGAFEPSGKTLFFTRLPFQGSHAKRYKGGTAQNLWRFAAGDKEAVPLTADYPGTSKAAMWWERRVYFATDRDGSMNIWSMNEDGKNLRQHTVHKGWDIQSPSLHAGRIVYQLGADIRLLDLRSGKDTLVPIRLATDFEHQRERWVKKPMDYVTSIHLSPDGDRVVLTARGQVFIAPAPQGRLVEATRKRGVRYRDGRFLPDGKTVLALSDESGEIEIWKMPANGAGAAEQLTSDGKVLRWEAAASPDGKWIAHHDKDQQLWLFEVSTRQQKRIGTSAHGGFSDLRWSPDSRWLAYCATAANSFPQVMLHNIETQATTALTTDRFYSANPAWSADGKWLYFLSDRNLESLVGSPWGPRQPEPFFDKPMKIYQAALKKGLRSPFQPADELHPESAKAPEGEKEKKEAAAAPRVDIDLDGLDQRITEVPAPPGNYYVFTAGPKRLYWVNTERGTPPVRSLQSLDIANKGDKPETLMADIRGYELSGDGKKLMFRKADDIFVVDATAKAAALKNPEDLNKSKVDLKDWTFALDPREEFRQMFTEAWRLERDYFYDRSMHGLDWPAVRKKYEPLAGRVTDRAELSDLLAQMISELSALHMFVFGGDHRQGQDQIRPGFLGAVLAREESAGGYRIGHIYRADPDLPNNLSPLAQPGVELADGDLIEAINGVPVLSAADPGVLLRNQADKQVLLRVKRAGKAESTDLIAKPITPEKEEDLRYEEWEYTRRLQVEQMGKGQIGYVHLRAMGSRDIAQWARHFYPVFNRQGLIIDVRHNRGGNIDSWILEKLQRKAWFYWKPRVGEPTWNMQYAFRGHMVALCNERTASDGEAFTEGFRRLGLGKAIGTRTWGGEIWLSASNLLVDRGIASAAEIGVYGPEGQWLIEGHGVDPDIVVDNPPHATFNGEDAQLQKAVDYLLEQIRLKPVPVPAPPPYPDKLR